MRSHGQGATPHLHEESSDPARLVADPLISVLMITYNHEDYLRQAIQSIVDQKCDLPFELIIGEDRSTDGSLHVALEYQASYPHIVRVIHSHENVGMNANSRRVRAAARGQLLAWCEGDDYWCHDGKLQEQAEILLSDPSVGAVHTDWIKSRWVGHAWEVDWDRSMHRNVPGALLSGSLLPVFHFPKILRTCTLMLRRSIAEACDASEFGRKDYDFGDAVTSLFITSTSIVAYVPKVTAVYRESPGSVLRSGIGARIRFLKSSLDFDSDARLAMLGNGRYPKVYRWELGVGLALWSLRARDWDSLKAAVRDIISHFSLSGFLRAAVQTVWMRRPAFPRRDNHGPG